MTPLRLSDSASPALFGQAIQFFLDESLGPAIVVAVEGGHFPVIVPDALVTDIVKSQGHQGLLVVER